MSKTGLMNRLVILLLTFGLGDQALAAEQVCREVEIVVKSVADEPCDAVVHEAEKCFDQLNERFALLKRLPGRSRDERLSSKEVLQADYTAALKTMQNYHRYLKSAGDRACIDQAGAMEIWIDETESDLRDLLKPGF